MRHHNSVFHDMVKRVPWVEFDRLVAMHQADKHVRRLPTKSQFIALLYGQLSGAASLREIVGGRAVSRSTLADANAVRPSAMFGELFAAMVTAANVNDITAAQAMPIEAGATYVFDLGYYDYGWWAKMDAAGCRIVTRFKSNTPLSLTAQLAVPDDASTD